MIYDNVTKTLQKQCCDMTAQYTDEYHQECVQKGSSLRFHRYMVTDLLYHKLGTLIGRDFQNFESYQSTVKDFLPTPKSMTIQNEEEIAHVEAACAAFVTVLDSVCPDCTAPACPYYRVICGDEADEIAYNILDKWGYCVDYWYPLKGEYDDTKLFLNIERLEPYMDEIRRFLGLPCSRINEYGESLLWGISPHCAEVEDLDEYGGCEMVYCPRDYSWLIYVSHEETITFAGTIVPGIKKILEAEKEHWNKWE